MMRIIDVEDVSRDVRVAIVVSRFNNEITEALLVGAVERLKELEVNLNEVTVVHVPGAIEIPITAQALARSKKVDVIIALGCVIRGETDHYDYVCLQVSEGCQQVMLQNDIPVIFGVLTTEDEEQAWERVGGEHGHKGRESADAALEMVSILRQL